MKKKFLAAILILSGAFAVNVNAQSPAGDTTGCTTQCKTVCKDKDCTSDKQKCEKAGKKGRDGRGDYMERAFEGITLTEAQKTAVAELYAKHAPQKPQSRAEKHGLKPTREERVKARMDFLKQMQTILTPEQYITFLENTAVNAPQYGTPRHRHHDKGCCYKHHDKKDRRDAKTPRDGKKGPRDGSKRQARPASTSATPARTAN